MFKNVAAKFIVFAFDATTNVPKTGDAANITAYVSKDYGSVTVLADTSATEMDATNAPGYYLFDAAQGETNADCLLVSAKSATSNIKVLGAPAAIYTRPTTGWLAPTTAGRTLDVTATGEAGIDWSNVGAPTTALDLSGTTIKTTQKVDVDTIKTNPVANGGTITFPTNATLASTTGAVGSVTGNVGGSVASVAANGITNNSFAAGAIDATAIAANAIGASELAADAVTEIQTAILADNSPFNGASIAAIKAKTDSLTFTVANQVDANTLKIATDAVDAAALKADAVTEIWAKAMAELSGPPGATGTVLQALTFLFMALRNVRTTTALADTIGNDAGATIATAVLSDDATTFTKGEYA